MDIVFTGTYKYLMKQYGYTHLREELIKLNHDKPNDREQSARISLKRYK